MNAVDAETFIRTHLRARALPAIPSIALYQAHSGSRLHHHGLQAGWTEDEAPYWAFAWGGGLALAHYLREYPALASGRSVLDLGSGSGLVAIAAAKAGASEVQASEVDPVGRVAIALNARLNGVTIRTVDADLLSGAPPACELLLVGDLFYETELARRVALFLGRCHAAGIEILIGDPGRRDLPLGNLLHLASYASGDFGSPARVTSVYRWIC